MALNTYRVTYTVPAPPCYEGDPHPRTAREERLIVTSDEQSAIDYVAMDPHARCIGFSQIAAVYVRRYVPD